MNPEYVVKSNLFSDLITDNYYQDNILSIKLRSLDDLNHYLVADEEFSNDWEKENSPLSFNDIFTDDLIQILNRLSLASLEPKFLIRNKVHGESYVSHFDKNLSIISGHISMAKRYTQKEIDKFLQKGGEFTEKNFEIIPD